jgi:uncharacterized membrane protein YbhN (UPF0104 family)
LGRPRDWLIGSAVLVLLVVVVEATLGWGQLLAPWRELSVPVLAAAFALTAASYLLRAVRVQVYFTPRLTGRFGTVLRLSVLHNTANNLLPMRAGELVFPWLMRRWLGYDLLAAGASLLWIRLLDLHFLGIIGLLVLWLRWPSPWWLLPALGWLAVLAPVSRLRRWGASSHAAERAGGGSVAHRLCQLPAILAASAPDDSTRIAKLYGWTALSWALKLAAFVVILKHFAPAAPAGIVAGVLGAELSSVLPIHGLAGSGSYEVAAMAAMVPLGVPPAAALAGAVNLHLFLLGTTLILGLAAWLWPRPGPADREGGADEASPP